jgi:acyl transferase domain-containing protein
MIGQCLQQMSHVVHLPSTCSADHAPGEIACGYADGGFTHAQTLLVAYHRSRMCRDHGVAGGLMAAVGLGAEEAERRLRQARAAGSVVACDNSPSSTTLSGLQAPKCARLFCVEPCRWGLDRLGESSWHLV